MSRLLYRFRVMLHRFVHPDLPEEPNDLPLVSNDERWPEYMDTRSVRQFEREMDEYAKAGRRTRRGT